MSGKHISIILAACIICSSSLYSQQYPFRDSRLPLEDRITNLISLMTLEEKITCLSPNPEVPRLGVIGARHVEGLHGVAKGGPSNWGQIDPVITTIFPQAIGLAETWNPELVKKAASVESYEARYMFQSPKYKKGGLVVFAPNADLGRDPRWGRNEECYGEDAFLNGVMTVAYVKGLQGDNPGYWRTAALMKHFLANSFEDGRDSTSADFDERLLREYYSYPFRLGVVEGGSRAFMASYNAVNGIPMTVNPILKNMAVDEWGQDGIICTDGGAFSLLVTAHKYYPDVVEAAAPCLRAGITEFLDRSYKDGIKGALDKGFISEATIDSAIRGNFRVMAKLGMLDSPENVPYSFIGIADTTDPWQKPETHLFVREVTRESIVLLKNSEGFLPLDKNKIKTLAVIGPRANEVLPDWYSGTPPYTVSPVQGIKNKAGEFIKIITAADSGDAAAVAAAKEADIVILCVGNHPTCYNDSWAVCKNPDEGREAIDRKTIYLGQEDLIKKVYDVNKNVVVVLISSFPYAINWTKDNIPAVLHLTHSSQELGNALADVLFGDYNPAGRLVQTWPSALEQLPPMRDFDIRNGRTYMYFKDKSLYPFGYGLSYTTFEYSDIRLTPGELTGAGDVYVTFKLENTGEAAGDEVVQLYVKHINSKVERPLKELKGFKRINLKPGETQLVQIPLKAESLAYWDQAQHRFIVEEDEIEVMIGSSSEDIKLTENLKVAH